MTTIPHKEPSRDASAQDGMLDAGLVGSSYRDLSTNRAWFDFQADDAAVLTAIGARRLATQFDVQARLSVRQARQLLRPRPMDASAADVLIDSPHAALWNLVAASISTSEGSDAFRRLVRLSDPAVDVTLAMRARDLTSAQASAVAKRIAGRLVKARAASRSSRSGINSPEHRQSTTTVDLLMLASLQLLTTGPDLGDAVLVLLRAGMRADTVVAWARNEHRTPFTAPRLDALLNDPGLAFGHEVQTVFNNYGPVVRRYLLGAEMMAHSRQFVLAAMSSHDRDVQDVMADLLRSVLFLEAQHEPVLARYVDERLGAAAAGDAAALAVGRRLATEWSGSIQELVDVVATVRATTGENPRLQEAV